jgi:peptidoglycan/LPS O-acetylase OafA/YrhL
LCRKHRRTMGLLELRYFRQHSATLQFETSRRTMRRIETTLAHRCLVNAIKMAWGTDAIGDSLARSAKRALPIFLGALRVTLYAVLAVLRPFIVAALSGVSLVGLALCLFFATLVPGSHFPMGLVLILSVACAGLIVVFYAVMEGLLPDS